jgi:hypothetical protein
MATPAYTIYVKDEVHYVVCPFCWCVHSHKEYEIVKSGLMTATCDKEKVYLMSEPFTPKQLHFALNSYEYETERKRRQYRKRKEAKALEKNTT